MNGRWVPHDTRDEVVDFVRELAELTELPVTRIVGWSGQSKGRTYGKVNEHNGRIPRDHWITEDEKLAILDFHGG